MSFSSRVENPTERVRGMSRAPSGATVYERSGEKSKTCLMVLPGSMRVGWGIRCNGVFWAPGPGFSRRSSVLELGGLCERPPPPRGPFPRSYSLLESQINVYLALFRLISHTVASQGFKANRHPMGRKEKVEEMAEHRTLLQNNFWSTWAYQNGNRSSARQVYHITDGGGQIEYTPKEKKEGEPPVSTQRALL